MLVQFSKVRLPWGKKIVEVFTMRNMMNAASARHARRVRADHEELAVWIARVLSRDGTVEAQPGLHFLQISSNGKSTTPCIRKGL